MLVLVPVLLDLHKAYQARAPCLLPLFLPTLERTSRKEGEFESCDTKHTVCAQSEDMFPYSFSSSYP